MLDNTEAIMVMLQHTQTTLLIEWDPCYFYSQNTTLTANSPRSLTCLCWHMRNDYQSNKFKRNISCQSLKSGQPSYVLMATWNTAWKKSRNKQLKVNAKRFSLTKYNEYIKAVHRQNQNHMRQTQEIQCQINFDVMSNIWKHVYLASLPLPQSVWYWLNCVCSDTGLNLTKSAVHH